MQYAQVGLGGITFDYCYHDYVTISTNYSYMPQTLITVSVSQTEVYNWPQFQILILVNMYKKIQSLQYMIAIQ